MDIKKVMVGMSGGVDSSVAAVLLKNRGYEVAGATFLLWDKPDKNDSEDVSDARTVCGLLGIEHYVFDMREEFREMVVDKFADVYASGETPNPCIFCNKSIKFKAFMERASALGYGHIATGHYASAVYDEKSGAHRIKKGKDARKDQSYVLYPIERERLGRIILPLGEYDKAEVRDIAEKSGLNIHGKAESQDICFIKDGNYAEFLREYTGKTPLAGDFVDSRGNILGRHMGITNYTVGQRRGLGISFGSPMFVCGIDAAQNTVIIAEEAALWKNDLTAHSLNWHESPEAGRSTRFLVKIRYAHKEQPASVTLLPDGTASVTFDSPQRAITPGQSVVFYNGDYVAGGGIIK